MPVMEQIMDAVLAALKKVPDVQLCERNRTIEVPEGTTPALVLRDGDLDGGTDRPGAYAVNRMPTFSMTLEPLVWGYVEGSDRTIGEKRSTLFANTVKTIFTDSDLRHLLASKGGGLSIEQAAFPIAATESDVAAAIFVLRLGISFRFDPANP